MVLKITLKVVEHLKALKRTVTLILALILVFSASLVAYADKAEFEYKLILTDQNGQTVTNPRALAAGSTLTVEIELTRTDTTATGYDTYGLEFRLMSRGLQYNNDGASFANGTPVRELHYQSGDSVGFAYYDMEQVGQQINNPALAGRWSYTVTDPGAVNITVPVALMYIVNDSESYEPIGNATLFLDPNGGEIVGEDVSGEYRSGTIVKLPDARFQDYKFLGWGDGADLYPAGSNYVVTGVVTLTAQWEGLVRDRQVIFNVNGGEFDDADPSGMYADGEIITIPAAHRDGYELIDWELYGEAYEPGEPYTVDNSVIFEAKWEPTEPVAEESGNEPEPEVLRDNDTPLVQWLHNPDGTVDGGHLTLFVIGLLILLGLLLWLFLILWKRRWVLYSLKNGDVALSYKEKEHDFRVEVVLFDEDENGNKAEYHLNKSGVIEHKHRLRFIRGQLEAYPIVQVEKGKYKGKLIVTDPEGKVTEEKARIKVLDREIRERENK